jgi:hypothetical protein
MQPNTRICLFILSHGVLALDPLQSKIVPSPAPDHVAQYVSFAYARKYQNENNDTICEYLKDGAVVKREIYLSTG